MTATSDPRSRRQPRVVAAFTEHPASVGESYGEHMGFAFRMAGRLAIAAGAAAVHAVLPFCFERTASRMIAEMHARTAGRGADPRGG